MCKSIMATKNGEVRALIFDIVFSNLIVGPLTVFYWKGTWGLLDLYLFPKDPKLSAWVNLSISLVISIPFYFFQNKLLKSSKEHQLLHIVLSRVYAYLGAFSSVGHWRGVWHLIDEYTGKAWLSCVLCIVIGVVVLGSLRGLRTAAAPPFVVITDTKHEYFYQIPTMIDAREKGRVLFLFDTLVTLLVVHSLIVVIWRGLWAYLDISVFPNDDVMSAVICLCTGYLLSFFTFTSERLFIFLSKKNDDNIFIRACVEDGYTVIMITAAVFMWRGIWKMQTLYLLDRQYLSNWVSHLIGYVLLTLMYASLSLVVRGYVRDFSKKNGESVRVPIQYLLQLHPDILQICSRKVSEEPQDPEAQNKY